MKVKISPNHRNLSVETSVTPTLIIVISAWSTPLTLTPSFRRDPQGENSIDFQKSRRLLKFITAYVSLQGNASPTTAIAFFLLFLVLLNVVLTVLCSNQIYLIKSKTCVHAKRLNALNFTANVSQKGNTVQSCVDVNYVKIMSIVLLGYNPSALWTCIEDVLVKKVVVSRNTVNVMLKVWNVLINVHVLIVKIL